jgi:DNA-binding PadR family transcriptional regulator
MNLTAKQKAILALVVHGNKDGTPIDLDQLIERVPYSPTKESMQFSVRAMVNKGLIEKGGIEPRRGRGRRIITATDLGKHWAALLCPKPVPLRVEEVLSDEELKKMEDDILNMDISS